jgi:Cytochrome c3/Cytochrome c7 and related cytochrome c
VSIFGAVFFVAALGWLLNTVSRSSWVTQARIARQQPVPFSHKHHVGDIGLDCRYCHASVEQAAFAGMPSTKTCMSCHSQIWPEAPMLEPVRESYRQDRSIPWTRVHDLPDFAFFDHSIHVAKGVGCQTCHGNVDQMPLAWRENTLNMEWCIGCHRAPERYLRPREEVFNMNWTPPENQLELGRELAQRYHVKSLTTCSTCHR